MRFHVRDSLLLWVLSSVPLLVGCGDDTGPSDVDDGSAAGAAGAGAGGSAANGGTAGRAGSGGGGHQAGASAGDGPGEGGSSAGGSGEGGSAGSDGTNQCILGDEAFEWPVEREPAEVPAHASWKSELTLPNEPFLSVPESFDADTIRWVKFTILLSDPETVYFQDSRVYPFHYDFAKERIPEFRGLSRQEFDALTLEGTERRAVLGAVLLPGDTERHPEYGVELVLNDEVHPEFVRTIVETVNDHIEAPAGTKPVYLPNPEQRLCVDEHAPYFEEHGLPFGTVDRWLVGDACYAPGWAIGRLVQLSADEVDGAYLDGTLRPEDVLLLEDAAPAELPYVAGVLTLAPSTPNSHTAILARSYAVPFAYVRRSTVAEQARALVGKQVVVSTQQSHSGDCAVRLIDVSTLSDAERAGIEALSGPPPLSIAAKRAAGVYSVSTEELVPDDIDRVGGKAANFGVVQRAVPANAPAPAIAFTFDLWDAFLDETAPGGTRTLREEIASRLEPHGWPADLLALDETLDGIRDLVRDAPFPGALAEEVNAALAGFDPETRIRFRSSTNVEDSESFTGAGLYDSVTGCLADDLDDDAMGPSLCNPNEPAERGVYRAIKRVFSSFYARNAYFQRLRRGVDENEVGMAILVHYSVPDEFELANGVATMNVQAPGSKVAELVTQLGAVSVTNPDGSATPETVIVERFETSDFARRVEGSSLVPLGGSVLNWDAEYRSLMGLLSRIADEYAATTNREYPFSLDFEYKKVEPGELSVRQVRPLPLPDTTEDVTPFLVGEPLTLCVFPGEVSDVFAMHRLKAKLSLGTGNFRMTGAAIEDALFTDGRVDYTAGGELRQLTGAPSSFPGAAHSVEGDLVTDSWEAADGRWTLSTTVDMQVARNVSPVLLPRDFSFNLTTHWDAEVPYLGWEGPGVRTEESITLWANCPDSAVLETGSMRVQKDFEGPNGIAVSTGFWFPPPPRGITAGYTAPIVKWESTTISGLTTEPIVLTGYYSQTHRPYHHNFGGDYIFEPALEAGISEQQLAELALANIAFVLIRDLDNPEGPREFWVSGLDGTLRPLSEP